MKRTFALLVAILCYFCTYSQEANEESRIPEFVVTPRFDANPYVPVRGAGYSSFDFSNSSLYTFLDGSIGDFSYSMSNHWLAEDTPSLYRDAFKMSATDFIDWLTLSYAVGQFSFTIGKDFLAVGSAEYDYNDVDVHYSLASPFWHKNAAYQWGVSIDFTSKEEETSLRLQVATSPFGVTWRDKLFAYSLNLYGEYGCFTPIYSVNFFEYERGRFVNLISLGNRFTFGDFMLEVDYMNRATSIKRFFAQEWGINGQLLYNYRDKLEVFVKGGYDSSVGGDIFGYEDEMWFIPTDGSLCPRYWFAGGGIHYFPLRESRDLRIHAVAAYNNFAKSVSMTFGATYYFNLTQTILNNRKK